MKFFGSLILCLFFICVANALPAFNIQAQHIPGTYSQFSEACVFRLEAIPEFENKIEFTYESGIGLICPWAGKQIELTCKDYFCHSGGDGVPKGDYRALYFDESGRYLMTRINRCHGSCRPSIEAEHPPLKKENANYVLVE